MGQKNRAVALKDVQNNHEKMESAGDTQKSRYCASSLALNDVQINITGCWGNGATSSAAWKGVPMGLWAVGTSN